VDEFMERMQAIIASIPYDNFTDKNLKLREQNYQTAVYLVFALMGQFVQTEVHSATGRADCVVTTADSIYIFEFKLFGNGTAEEALAQIIFWGGKKPRRQTMSTDGHCLTGFEEATRTIKNWKAETLEK